MAFSEDSAGFVHSWEDEPVFTYLSFDFFFLFLFYRGSSSALHPTPNLHDQVSLLASPRDRVAQLYLQAPGFIFSAVKLF
jgi:hypothetical protein